MLRGVSATGAVWRWQYPLSPYRKQAIHTQRCHNVRLYPVNLSGPPLLHDTQCLTMSSARASQHGCHCMHYGMTAFLHDFRPSDHHYHCAKSLATSAQHFVHAWLGPSPSRARIHNVHLVELRRSFCKSLMFKAHVASFFEVDELIMLEHLHHTVCETHTYNSRSLSISSLCLSMQSHLQHTRFLVKPPGLSGWHSLRLDLQVQSKGCTAQPPFKLCP